MLKQAKVATSERQLVIGATYRHFKGKYYLVREVVKDSETQQEMVLYQPLYGGGEIPSYVRPLEMFLSRVDKVKYPQAKQKWRFQEAPVVETND